MSKRQQPQRLPPPITHGKESLDAEVILREIQDERLALLLWKTVRSVRLWGALRDRERAKAFEASAYLRRRALVEEAEVPAELVAPLERASSVLQARPRATTVAAACREISEWACARGAMGTALELMQAAALVRPEDAELARVAARLARTKTEYHRAETWYRHAVSRARRARQWQEFTQAYLGLGIVLMQRGAYPAAQRSLIRALRAAKRFSLRNALAGAYHELVVLGIRTDRAADVVRYARHAVDAYGPGHPALVRLSQDVGVFLLNAGYFAAARRVFEAIPLTTGGPFEQLARAVGIVRAAGACGDAAAYERELARAEELIGDSRAAPGLVQAHIAIARGAAHLGNLERAREAAKTAHSLAEQRGEGELLFAAESILQSVDSAIAVRAAVEPTVAAPTPQLESLVEELEMAIEASAGR